MTIKIMAYQRRGEHCKELADKFEFCCWYEVQEWFKNFKELHKCQECKSLSNSSTLK